MIARVWYGHTEPGKSDGFLDYLKETGVKDIRSTEGNRGVYVLRREGGGRAEFVVLSLWKSLEAIERFSGSGERPRYYPRDHEFLLELHPDAAHYEVAVPEDVT